MAGVIITGTPNARGLEMLCDAFSKWLEAGQPCYQCQECFAPLKTDAEREAHFCERHMTTRHVYTYEEALAAIEKSNRRKAARRTA